MNTNTDRHAGTTEKGSSLALVFVVLIAAITAVFSSVSLTYEHFERTKMERDATKATLDADEIFNCVRYWVNLDDRYFTDADEVNDSGTYTFEVWTEETEFASSTLDYVGTGNGTSSVCAQTRFDFRDADTTNGVYVEGTDYATSTFTVGYLRAEIVRNLNSGATFDGVITIYSRTDENTGPYLAERLQRHWYRVGVKGADVVIVVDRSGSIGGKRTPTSAATNKWRDLVIALTETIGRFDALYDIRFGVVSFSDGSVTTSGKRVMHPDCPDPLIACLQEPDIPLTDIEAELPSWGTVHNNVVDDDIKNMSVIAGATNISYGLAAAGAELLGKYYPAGTASQVDDFVAAGKEAYIPGGASGWLEHSIARGLDLESELWDKPIPDSDHGDRPDGSFPDFIFLITDGEPNQVPAATSTAVDAGYPLALAAGATCFVGSSTLPVHLGMTTTLYGVAGDLSEKCNATLVKRALNEYGITFGAIGVGVTTVTENWLSDHMADIPYVRAANYAQLQQALAILFGGIALLEYK